MGIKMRADISGNTKPFGEVLLLNEEAVILTMKTWYNPGGCMDKLMTREATYWG